ncbi:MAG: pyruvate kinase [Clostridia bacterium]|nr:pyruvate kinase [Clostridia bacterium]
MRKTKIVCTIGPASDSEEIMRSLIESGMNVARLNFSHGTLDMHKKNIETLKKLRDEMEKPVAIMLDTKGPEIRIKEFKDSKAVIKDGDTFTLTTKNISGDNTKVAITYPSLPQQVSEGATILIDDGNIELEVVSATEEDIVCKVIRGGLISNKKGINLPGTRIDMPYLSNADKEDLLFGIENDVDFVAASFIRNKDDVINLRKFLDFNGGHDINIISKIESSEGVENFDEILEYSDGIMVARGDMGVEVEFEYLPGLQKKFIKKCYCSGKMVITATQMLESMINNANPTRAEISDVANAVFDGTSAVMLSGETAMGKYPVLAVEVMSKIVTRAEMDAFKMNAYGDVRYDTDFTDITNALCDAACTTAKDMNASVIISVSKYGQTARRTSKFRPQVPIVAATPVKKTFHQLALSWGVYPVLARYQKTSDDLFIHAIDCAKQIDLVKKGDRVVIVAGIPLDTPGNTNTLRVATV